MYRMVHIVERNGQVHKIPMTAQQADFYMKLAEIKAMREPEVTFHDVVMKDASELRQNWSTNTDQPR